MSLDTQVPFNGASVGFNDTALPVNLQALDEATIREHCRILRLPTVSVQCDALAQEAIRTRQSHLR